MKENKYDDERFFEKYGQMNRSQKGLEGAGEWHALKTLLPSFEGKRVLDLGCGFGWHCIYAAKQGAASVVGVDLSEKMIRKAQSQTKFDHVRYLCMPIEDYDYPSNSFDVVISSLAFHYVSSFEDICRKVRQCLFPDGDFVFSVEHPIFTASGPQQWYCDGEGKRRHWPVDRYFDEGYREAVFLGEKVTKYHKTLTTYINGLLQNGFRIESILEPKPDRQQREAIPEMNDELRRPMMLLIAAKKKGNE